MDRALGVEPAVLGGDGIAVEGEFDDVVDRDKLGAARAGEEVAAGIGRMAGRDVAEVVDDALAGEDAVGDDEICQGMGDHRVGAVAGHGGPPVRRRRAT